MIRDLCVLSIILSETVLKRQEPSVQRAPRMGLNQVFGLDNNSQRSLVIVGSHVDTKVNGKSC